MTYFSSGLQLRENWKKRRGTYAPSCAVAAVPIVRYLGPPNLAARLFNVALVRSRRRCGGVVPALLRRPGCTRGSALY